MTAALIGYSSVFMRYALAVTPKNYLLFGCHAVNWSAQVVQGYRYLNHWQYVLQRSAQNLSPSSANSNQPGRPRKVSPGEGQGGPRDREGEGHW